MKNMRKIVAMLLALVLCMGLLTACQGNSGTSTKKFVVLNDSLDEEEYAIGFRKGDIALGLEVQRILDEMIASGDAAKISKTWFEEDILLKDAAYLKETEAPAGDESLNQILQKGKLILGLDDSFPPMGFRDEDNNIVGFDIDLARAVAEKLGVELVLQPIDWDAKEVELASGRIDCIWNGMTVTPERVEAMFFAKPYLANRQVIIVPEGSSIKTRADLNGKTVALQQGSSSLDALMKDPVGEQVKEIVQLKENVTAFFDLKAGRVDAFVVDEVVGRYIMANN